MARSFPPLVSIVTLNYNQAEVTCALLASLARVTYPNVEVIVVDNGSAPADVARLAEAVRPGVRLLQSATNLGFTGGNNLGIRAARGAYVLLLNNDTVVAPGFLGPLVQALEADPEVGAVSPKIRYFAEPNRLQYAGGTAVNPYTGQGRWIGTGEIDAGQHDRSGPTEMTHGAAMLVRRRVFETVGLLGEAFFIYYEELDFGTRMRRAGWQLRYVSESLVWHRESVTMGKASPLKAYYGTRNRLLYLRRNEQGRRFWLGALRVVLAAGVHVARYLAAGERTHVGAVLRGLAWHLRPRALPPDEPLAPRLERVVLPVQPRLRAEVAA